MQLSRECFRWGDEESDDEAQPLVVPATSQRSRTDVFQNHRGGAAWFRWDDQESDDEAQPVMVPAESQITHTDVFPNHPGAAAEESQDGPSRAYADHNRKRTLRRQQTKATALEGEVSFDEALEAHAAILSVSAAEEATGQRCVACLEPIHGVLCANSKHEPLHWACAGCPRAEKMRSAQVRRGPCATRLSRRTSLQPATSSREASRRAGNKPLQSCFRAAASCRSVRVPSCNLKAFDSQHANEEMRRSGVAANECCASQAAKGLLPRRPMPHGTATRGDLPHSSRRGGAAKLRAAPEAASVQRTGPNEALPRPYVVRSTDFTDGALTFVPGNCGVAWQQGHDVLRELQHQMSGQVCAVTTKLDGACAMHSIFGKPSV